MNNTEIEQKIKIVPNFIQTLPEEDLIPDNLVINLDNILESEDSFSELRVNKIFSENFLSLLSYVYIKEQSQFMIENKDKPLQRTPVLNKAMEIYERVRNANVYMGQ